VAKLQHLGMGGLFFEHEQICESIVNGDFNFFLGCLTKKFFGLFVFNFWNFSVIDIFGILENFVANIVCVV